MNIGDRFDKLVILELFPHRRAMVLCDCGNEKLVFRNNLGRGNTTSCGCVWREYINKPRTHGHTQAGVITRTYRTWVNMLTRCRNRKDSHRARYYDGVTCDPKWESFENFLADMGERPEGKTLDRIDPYGHYAPGNCRWATALEQARNKKNKFVNHPT